ncbi:MAG: hypothetical protein SNJ84_08940 [Verrucomicrobiia bacterium]
MIVLKPYQNRVLGSLTDFLKGSSSGKSLHQAFYDVLTANGFPEVPYITVVSEGLGASMPYVCLRVPTGGGHAGIPEAGGTPNAFNERLDLGGGLGSKSRLFVFQNQLLNSLFFHLRAGEDELRCPQQRPPATASDRVLE